MTLRSRDKAALFLGGLILLATVGPGLYVSVGLLYLVATHPSKWDVVQSKGSDCKFKDAQPFSNGRDLIAILRVRLTAMRPWLRVCPSPLFSFTVRTSRTVATT